MKLFKSLLAAIVFALFMPINLASAQTYPCPYGGPSPGHRVVGQTPAGPGIASVPLCTPDGTGQSSSQEPPTPVYPPSLVRDVDSTVAVAWHNNASDVWAVWNTPKLDEAEKLALQNCNAVMRSGCSIAAAGKNKDAVIVKGANGMMSAGLDAPWHNAKYQALARCKDPNGECRVFKSYSGINYEHIELGTRATNGVGIYSPLVTSDLFHKYAVMAFASGPREGPLRETAWISSGHADIEEARRVALDACQKDSAKPCEVGAYTANGKIYFYRPNKGDLIVFSEHADEYAAKNAGKLCKARKLKCAMVAVYDAKTPGLVKRDFLIDQTKPSGKSAKGK
jgi:Domain of unknown function (DUF4189)